MGEFTRTTCRFGAYRVPDVMMSHRQCMDVEPAPAVWVAARMPLALYEVAALVSDAYESLAELADVTAGDARRWVAELLCGGGAEVVGQAVSKVDGWLTAGEMDPAYWQACLDLAAAMTGFASGEAPAEAGSVQRRRWLTRTACRFGSHEVPRVAMMHRGLPGTSPAAPTVVLEVAVPLTLDEVAAVLSAACTDETGEPRLGDVDGLQRTPEQARRFIAETVCDGGTELVADTALKLEEWRAAGRLESVYWQVCLATARAAVAGPRRPRIGERVQERPAQRGLLATAGGAR